MSEVLVSPDLTSGPEQKPFFIPGILWGGISVWTQEAVVSALGHETKKMKRAKELIAMEVMNEDGKINIEMLTQDVIVPIYADFDIIRNFFTVERKSIIEGKNFDSIINENTYQIDLMKAGGVIKNVCVDIETETINHKIIQHKTFSFDYVNPDEQITRIIGMLPEHFSVMLTSITSSEPPLRFPIYEQ